MEEYAYANVQYDAKATDAGRHGFIGRWVAIVHDTAERYFIDPEQVETLETKGDIDRMGLYVRMIKFDRGDQLPRRLRTF
jgi:hypothetical protein